MTLKESIKMAETKYNLFETTDLSPCPLSQRRGARQ
jgi:hypothetical protein